MPSCHTNAPPSCALPPSPSPPLCRLGCGQVVTQSFKAARAYVERYEELRVVNDFCMSFDANSYKQEQRDVVQFRKDMSLLR